jgi:hypothetical protein
MNIVVISLKEEFYSHADALVSGFKGTVKGDIRELRKVFCIRISIYL